MYTDRNFKTKKALREAVAAGEQVTYHQPGIGMMKTEGLINVEGPHYPAAHTWYAECFVIKGLIVKVK